jgi:hypothetical protein
MTQDRASQIQIHQNQSYQVQVINLSCEVQVSLGKLTELASVDGVDVDGSSLWTSHLRAHIDNVVDVFAALGAQPAY